MNALELRTHVRSIMDLSGEELADSDLNRWAVEATRFIHRVSWPWQRARVTVTATTGVIAMSTLMHGTQPFLKVLSIESPTRQLNEVDAPSIRRRHLSDARGEPVDYAVDQLVAPVLLLAPVPEVAVDLDVEGRIGASNWLVDDSSEPDVPDEFDSVIIDWMLHRVHASLGDGFNSAYHLDMAQETVREIYEREIRPDSDSPTIMGGGERRDPPVIVNDSNIDALQNWRLA